MLLSLVFSRLKKAPMPFFARPIALASPTRRCGPSSVRRYSCTWGYMESELGKAPWFAGEQFSAADIQMSSLSKPRRYAGPDTYPNLAGFLQRIHARPAYQRALEQGGPFDLLG